MQPDAGGSGDEGCCGTHGWSPGSQPSTYASGAMEKHSGGRMAL